VRAVGPPKAFEQSELLLRRYHCMKMPQQKGREISFFDRALSNSSIRTKICPGKETGLSRP